MIEVWCDGCCEPVNPGGFAGFGAAIHRDGKVLHEISGFIDRAPTTSNNVAEYSAFLAALEWLESQGLAGEEVLVRADSKLVIEQMRGRWRIKEGHYVPFAHRARKLLARFPRARLQWVPRKDNAPADRLSKAELIRRGVRFRIQPEEAQT